MKTPIQNSIALVTGANRGIGRSIVEALLARGAAKVYAAARNPESLADLVSLYHDRVVALKLDVTSPEQVTAAAAAASDATLIINNAGVVANPDLFGENLDGARQEFEVNYWGTLGMIRAFVPSLKASGGGNFVNLSSIAGLTNFPMLPTYSDSKAAVHSLTVGARLLLSQAHIGFLGVYPGPVDTDMAQGLDMPKASSTDVANLILDGVESGADEVFPDTMAEGYAGPYEAGHKTLERSVATMMAGG
jgi:NAD(P)-dependent dehydrogenase (short-subunit alcohol dehydrogenase family)